MFVRVLKRLLVLALSLLVISGILELGFRAFAPQVVTPRMDVEAPLGGHRVRPRINGYVRTPEFTFHVITDDLGLREGDRDILAKKSSYRILGLGDSFAFGLGVDAQKSYLRRTEHCLNETPRPGGPVQVINAGIPGSGTADQLAFFLDVGRQLSPDLVWLSFYYNDVQDNWNSDLFSFSASGVQRKPRPEGRSIIRAAHRAVDLIPLFGWLRERSHLLGFLSVRLSIILEGLRTGRLQESQPNSGGLQEEQWRMTERLLGELSRQSQVAVQSQPAFLLMYVPYKFQILKPEKPLEQEEAKLAWDIEPRVARFAAGRGIPFLSLTEQFRTAPTPATLYFRQDHHLSDEGNRLAAEAACTFLRRHALRVP